MAHFAHIYTCTHTYTHTHTNKDVSAYSGTLGAGLVEEIVPGAGVVEEILLGAEGVGEVVMGAHGVRAGRRRLLRGEGDHWIVEPEPTTSTVGLSYQSPETGEQPSLSVRQT